MQKTEAIELLGGSVATAAKALKITYQAVRQWPDSLSDRIIARVVAATHDNKPGGGLRKEGSARRDGYKPALAAFSGIGGTTRWCNTCLQHKAMREGWRKLKRGMSCPECVKEAKSAASK